MYEHFWKRLIDIVLSTLGIIILAIPMLVVAIIIKIDSPGPVFFKQKRVGKNKKFFTIIKKELHKKPKILSMLNTYLI